MKKSIFLLSLIAFSLQLFAETSAELAYPSLPSNTRLRVVASNVLNYLSDFEASNASCKTQGAFDTKTDEMATVFTGLQADIVALCEVQQDDEILRYIVDAMNKKVGKNVYEYVLDGSTYSRSSDGYGSIKCGYIYRYDKLTEGNRYSTNSGDKTFRLRMQVISFTEKSTKEKFVLSLNHFQAKTSDPNGTKRQAQASTLVNALKTNYGDPDILIVGDLNADIRDTETTIRTIVDGGYEEQLLKYDANAYSYTYYGQRQLIDHAMANSTMANQITGAYVYHLTNYDNYSDHDVVLVGVNLGNRSAIDYVTPEDDTTTRHKIYRNGQLYIQVGEHLFDVMGRKVE